jgi:hypothetical protein
MWMRMRIWMMMRVRLLFQIGGQLGGWWRVSQNSRAEALRWMREQGRAGLDWAGLRRVQRAESREEESRQELSC